MSSGTHLDRLRPPEPPTALFTTFHRDELDLIAAFACTLNEKPGKNWVEAEGGLPDYICRIARAIKRSGRTTSQAVAIAVSRVKKWAAGGGDVDADTRAKAARALAQWERLKAKAGKGKTVRASHVDPEPAILCLAATDYNVDMVRSAWDKRIRDARIAWRAANPQAAYDEAPSSMYVKELWTTYLITQSGYGDGATLHKVPYTVDDDGTTVTFADPTPVKVEYVTISEADTGGAITDKQIQQMMSATAAVDSLHVGLTHITAGLAGLRLPTAPAMTALAQLQALPGPATRTALDQVVALAASAAKPYGKVAYADPGYQADNKARYPIDSADHVRAAWSYINQQANAGKYTAVQLKAIKGRIKAAARRFGVSISDT